MKKQQDGKGKRAGRRILAAAALLLVSAFLMIGAAQMPAFAEWYSEHIYPLIVTTVGRVMGIFPFSVVEVCLYLLLAGVAASVIVLIVNCIRKGGAGNRIFRWFSKIALTVGILAFLYTLGCGITYHRESFSQAEGIVTSDYGVEELKEVCLWLTQEVNAASSAVTRDDSGLMELEAPEEKEQWRPWKSCRKHFLLSRDIILSEEGGRVRDTVLSATERRVFSVYCGGELQWRYGFL